MCNTKEPEPDDPHSKENDEIYGELIAEGLVEYRRNSETGDGEYRITEAGRQALHSSEETNNGKG